MKTRTRAFALLVMATLSLASCGSSRPVAGETPRPDGSRSPSEPADGAGDASPSVTQGTARAKDRFDPVSSPSPGSSSTLEGTAPAPLKVDISKCVRPGQTQTLSITTTPGFDAAWGTEWPDREPHPEWGSNGTQQVPKSGTLTKTWLVPPTAPKGLARTDVVVSGVSNGERQVSFKHPGWKISSSC